MDKRKIVIWIIGAAVIIGVPVAFVLLRRAPGADLVFVRFDDTEFQTYTGCYEKIFLRKQFIKKNEKGEKVDSMFSYCSRTDNWLLLDHEVRTEYCADRSDELAYSSNELDVLSLFDERWYAASSEPLNINFVWLSREDEGICPRLANGICDDDLNIQDYGFDMAECCSTACDGSDCVSWKENVAIFDMNTSGIDFPSCTDPSLKDLTIRLNNFSTSYEAENLDILYPNRQPFFDRFFDKSKSVKASIMKIKCDGRYVLVAEVDSTMSGKAQTIRVNDGANCSVLVDHDIKQSNCTTDCHLTEDPFWVFDYSIFEGEDTASNKLMLSDKSIGKETSSFWRVPVCFTDALSPEMNGVSKIYEDDIALNVILKWMTRDRDRNSDCDSKDFLAKFPFLYFLSGFASESDLSLHLRDSLSVCDWHYVNCYTDNSFELDLSYFGLRGTIPKAIEKLELLSGLVSLSLAYNHLTGSIPSQIGKLTQLTTFDLVYNELKGSIPSEIGKLTQLTTLDFRFADLTGAIPSEIGNLTHLTTLNFIYNELKGSIPSEIGKLTQLTILDLDHNAITGNIPSEIGNLTHLTTLNFRWTNLTGAIPSEIGNLTHLTTINFGNTDLTGAIPSEIGKLTQLEYLALSSNDLIGPIPSEIWRLTQLTMLDLDIHHLTGTIPSEIGKLTQLTKINYRYTGLTGVIPSEIGKLTQLEYLDLDKNDITGTIPSEIGKLTQLTILYLGANNLTGSIPSEIGKLTHLKSLYLSGNNLTGSIPSEIEELTDTNLVLGRQFHSDGNGDIAWEAKQYLGVMHTVGVPSGPLDWQHRGTCARSLVASRSLSEVPMEANFQECKIGSSRTYVALDGYGIIDSARIHSNFRKAVGGENSRAVGVKDLVDGNSPPFRQADCRRNL